MKNSPVLSKCLCVCFGRQRPQQHDDGAVHPGLFVQDGQCPEDSGRGALPALQQAVPNAQTRLHPLQTLRKHDGQGRYVVAHPLLRTMSISPL